MTDASAGVPTTKASAIKEAIKRFEENGAGSHVDFLCQEASEALSYFRLLLETEWRPSLPAEVEVARGRIDDCLCRLRLCRCGSSADSRAMEQLVETLDGLFVEGDLRVHRLMRHVMREQRNLLDQK
jgi:hypothetical protein